MTTKMASLRFGWAVWLLLGVASVSAAQTKHLLVVSITKGFRHTSIEVGEEVMRQLSARTGEFTVDFASVNPGDPRYALSEQEQRANEGRGRRRGNPKVDAAIEEVLRQKMSPEALQRYDAVVFLNTTGNLPIPDVDAFLDWIRAGHAFIGMHAASDTFHGQDGPSDYCGMLCGEFASHGPQVEVRLHNVDPEHAANAKLPAALTVFEEMYLFKNYQRSLVHSLLNMDAHPNTKEPGHYPVSWCRDYGKGRVFYTSLGHREDIWDPAWTDADGQRKNPPDVARAYQEHLLGGIRWALGLAAGDSKPQDLQAAALGR
jgi:type 1 glutamine amidotransferase